jgi:hypothetical protein
MTPPGLDEPPSAGERPKTRPKQALIRPDQQTSLDDLARSLHDARSVKGERITANTVLRVAIDGLVEHGDRLHGDNEVQLLASWREFVNLAASLGSLEAVLADVAREVGGPRSGERDPVTPATLVRIAVAGLAEYRGALHGASEAELLASWLAFLGEREAATGR